MDVQKKPKPSGRVYSQKTIKILFGQLNGRCVFPGCRKQCITYNQSTGKTTVTGQIAHVRGVGPAGPRFLSALTKTELNSPDNLLILCYDHHKEVDEAPGSFPVETLLGWKADFIKWLDDCLAEQSGFITFIELAQVTKALVVSDRPLSSTVDFSLTAPTEKIRKNGLGQQATAYIRNGMSSHELVSGYVRDIALADATYPERLTLGFRRRYDDLVAQGIAGDELFSLLVAFATSGSKNFLEQSAAVAVVVYLFNVCELFEK